MPESMDYRKLHYRVGSTFWAIVGIYVAIHSYQLGLGRLSRPGPGFIFFLAALLLTILAAIDLAGTFFWKTKIKENKTRTHIWSGFRWRKVLMVLGGLSAYVYLFNFAGFFLSTFLLMVFLYKGIEPTKWRTALGSSLITILLSYAIFSWLKVPFPKGFLGF